MNDILLVADEVVPAVIAGDMRRIPRPEAVPYEPLPAFPHPLQHPLRALWWIVRTTFGIASLMLLLAVVAAIPLLNILVLGYLLEVMGRTARTGKFREAFPLINLAPRLGSIAIGFWICLFPLRLLSIAAADARLIDPGSRSDVVLHTLTNIGAVFITIHICLSLARGGSLSCFFRPIKNARWLWKNWKSNDYLPQAAEHVQAFIAGLRLKHHFLLGLKGLIGAFLWLIIPTAIFASAKKPEGGDIIATLIGGFGLVLVLCWLPFLMARFAAENRIRAMFELKAIRELFTRAPILWAVAIVITCVMSLPMYLFKIALPPQDAMWLETLVFLVTIWPVKVFTGWAYYKATQREARRGRLRRWTTKLFVMPIVAFYVFLLFFTQFIGEHGKGVLFEHHAFLLPIPF
ncbi:MAG: DUF4013 domain-containing protein [Planctomycetaceae bacterium]